MANYFESELSGFMKKRIASALLVVTLLVTLAFAMAGPAFGATSGACGDDLTWTLDTNTGVLEISGTGDMTEYYELYAKGYGPGVPWFDMAGYVKTVVISEGVTSISGYAFCTCKNLESISMPDSLVKIGEHAFAYCESLKNVTIPAGVTELAYNTFYYCTALENAKLPQALTEIGTGAFYKCDSLSGLTIPETVTHIGNYAFYDCRSLKTITIPAAVETLYCSSFIGCAGLTAIDVDPGNERFASRDGVLFTKDMRTLMRYPQSKKGAYVMPDTVFSLGAAALGEYSAAAFDNCTGLTSVVLSSGLAVIDVNEFSGCTSLSQVSMSEGLTEIGYAAFGNCPSLKTVTVPTSVTKIGNVAFSHLSSIYFLGDAPEIESYSLPYNVTVYYPIATDGWSTPLWEGYTAYPYAPGFPFTDVSASAWYYKSIVYVHGKGLFSGTSARTFSPDTPMTLAMMAQVLYNLSGAQNGGESWYDSAVLWAHGAAILNGVEDTSSPTRAITREEMAVMLYNYCLHADISLLPLGYSRAPFEDEDAIGLRAKTAVNVMYEAGVLNGRDGSFDPQGGATRAEAAQMFRNFMLAAG